VLCPWAQHRTACSRGGGVLCMSFEWRPSKAGSPKGLSSRAYIRTCTPCKSVGASRSLPGGGPSMKPGQELVPKGGGLHLNARVLDML